jgi:Thermolysin metallopeptidase, alpha-helical domain/Thermolysin metallopeptidase, catalytic domain
MSCTIIPPYLLEALANAADAHVAAGASATLLVDERLRRARAARTRPDAAASTLPRDDGTHPSRGVFDAKTKQALPGTLVRSEGGKPTKDAAADEAYDGLGSTWALFSEVFGRDSLDGHGEALIGTVHYGKGYDNAFWNGTQMVFGDGDGVIFNRFTASIDVIGHELTHAVTERTAGLVYDGQSGALNESLSDVFGSLVKQRVLGETAQQADWLIGAGLLAPGVKGTALRSMSHPGTAYDDPRLGKDPQPDSMAGYVTTTRDNGGVHINSGIPNRAFYLVARAIGGNAWQAPGQIWFDTILGAIKPDCDFATFAGLTIAAASARFGATSSQADAVRAAWATVGVLKAGTPPASKPKHKTAGQLTVTRTGGFAGLSQERTVALAALPDHERKAWTTALRQAGTLDLDAAEPWPDAFCYGITCTHPEVDVQLPEHALPDALRQLVERLLGN